MHKEVNIKTVINFTKKKELYKCFINIFYYLAKQAYNTTILSYVRGQLFTNNIEKIKLSRHNNFKLCFLPLKF